MAFRMLKKLFGKRGKSEQPPPYSNALRDVLVNTESGVYDSNIPAAIQAIYKVPQTEEYKLAIATLLDRMVERDPHGTIVYTEANLSKKEVELSPLEGQTSELPEKVPLPYAYELAIAWLKGCESVYHSSKARGDYQLEVARRAPMESPLRALATEAHQQSHSNAEIISNYMQLRMADMQREREKPQSVFLDMFS